VVRTLEPHDERALIDARRLAIALKVGKGGDERVFRVDDDMFGFALELQSDSELQGALLISVYHGCSVTAVEVSVFGRHCWYGFWELSARISGGVPHHGFWNRGEWDGARLRARGALCCGVSRGELGCLNKKPRRSGVSVGSKHA
jgi:hypothetical protein